MSDLSHGAIAIIGHRFNQQRDAARAITFVSNLFVIDVTFRAGAAAYGAIDRVVRHVPGLGVGNRFAQPRIGVRITAAATRCDRQFFNEFGEELAAFGIRRALLVLNRMPLRMSRHVKSVILQSIFVF